MTQVTQTDMNASTGTMPSGRQNMFTLAPRTLAEAMEYAKIIADSGMVPKDFQGRPANVLVAVQMGAELGLPPTQALQNIAVINGRPSIWGDAVLALVKASPLCEYLHENFDAETGTATCITKRRADKQEVIRSFSYEDAKRAGLWGKQGPWQQYPQRMTQMRARSWAVRDAFPDLLRGISVREEQMDTVEKDVTPSPQVRSASRTDSLLHRLKKESTEEIDQHLELVLDQIARATTEEQLIEVSEIAKNLPKRLQSTVRKAYKDKLLELRISADVSPEQPPAAIISDSPNV